MRCLLLILSFLFISFPISTQILMAQPIVSQENGALIRKIRIEGFVLQDKNVFVKLFRSYRNKRLTESDINDIIQKLQEIYEQAGYQGLISMDYKIVKTQLVFSVALIK